MNEFLSAALSHARRYGVAVVPIVGKRPVAPHGYASASSDPVEISRLFRDVSATGVGIAALDALVILDVDDESALTECEPLPETLTTRSGGGGLHLLYRRPGGVRLAYRRDRFPLGIEVKLGSGGTVAPPSIHPDTGSRYRWERVTAIADTPAWLVERLTVPPPPPRRPLSELVLGDGETRYGLAGLQRYAHLVAAAPEGARRNTLNWCAYSAAQLVPTGHLRAESIETVLHDAALACGLPEREIRTTLARAVAEGQQRPFAPEAR